MPTYQYACKQCGEGLEVQQSFTDDALTECPACGGALRKMYNAVGVVFKGSGFYRTDSRGSQASSDAGSPGHSPDSGSGGSAATKSSESGSSSTAGSSTTSKASAPTAS